MKKLNVLFAVISFSSSISFGQIIDTPSDTVAGIPANYTEAKVGSYILPDPLKCLDGQIVDSPELWSVKRRGEIIKLFEQNQFGVTPKSNIEISYDVSESEGSAFDNLAKRTQVTLNLKRNGKEKKIDVLYYLPSNITEPVPVLLYISFRANLQVFDDPQIKDATIWNMEKKRVPAPRESMFGKFDAKPILENGFGFATVYYGDIEPDFSDGYQYGVRNLFDENRIEDKSDSWGSIAVWSWGLSRILDYFETDKNIDADAVTVMGVSRLGKTALWAGSLDERFAAVIDVCSGESGSTLSRRNYGETVAHIASPSRFSYWFAPKYQDYGNDVSSLPVDGHMLVSLIAPRPILLITGNTDKWSDPYGAYLSVKAAEPVYQLLGKKGLETDQMPVSGTSVISDLSFFMHVGGHGMVDEDWGVIIEFLNKHFK